MYFTSNIKFLRKRKGRTQDEVAVSLNLKRSTLSGYENGIAEPDIETLVRLFALYGLSADDVFDIKKSVNYSIINLNAKERELLRNYRMLTTKDQNLLLVALQAIVDYSKKNT